MRSAGMKRFCVLTREERRQVDADRRSADCYRRSLKWTKAQRSYALKRWWEERYGVVPALSAGKMGW